MEKNNEKGGISLPKIPKDKEYEDFIAAILQSGGYYLERGIIYRIKQDVLELDIVSTRFSEGNVERAISEIKSGGWGLSDIFKIRGWLDYLNLDKASFVVQIPNQIMTISKDIASKINVTLIDNQDLDCSELLKAYSISKEQVEDEIIESFRYAFALEAEMIIYLHSRVKSEPEKVGFKKLEKYLFDINSNSFFVNKPVDRINKLFASYLENKNITARIGKEIKGNAYPDSGNDLTIDTDQFELLFYAANDKSVLYVALYAELLARIAILKSCIEDIIIGNPDNFIERLKHFTLPSNIKSGLEELQKEPYSYLYPYFWQVFVYLFGGFILNDKKEEEYKLLSSITQIPVENIPDAFDAFDKLFPLNRGKKWLIQLPKSNITVMQFFPYPLSGIGANFRRMRYKNEKDDSYENLSKQITGEHTINDVIKWNNLAYKFLVSSARKKKS